jgi:hypothetical protein
MVWPGSSYTIAYDGINPMPRMLCYLKPYYNDQSKSYFHQLADGELQMMTPAASEFGLLLDSEAAAAMVKIHPKAFQRLARSGEINGSPRISFFRFPGNRF